MRRPRSLKCSLVLGQAGRVHFHIGLWFFKNLKRISFPCINLSNYVHKGIVHSSRGRVGILTSHLCPGCHYPGWLTQPNAGRTLGSPECKPLREDQMIKSECRNQSELWGMALARWFMDSLWSALFTQTSGLKGGWERCEIIGVPPACAGILS